MDLNIHENDFQVLNDACNWSILLTVLFKVITIKDVIQMPPQATHRSNKAHRDRVQSPRAL